MELDGSGGYGDGSGGYGDGSGGYGYGYGYGYGSGDGDGYGYGYGYGYAKEYLTAVLKQYERTDAVIAVWRSTPDGLPANGGMSAPAAEGQIQEIKGPLELCSSRALHGTLLPHKWKGDRWWVVALHHPVKEDGDKIGSLKRTILKDLGKCPF